MGQQQERSNNSAAAMLNLYCDQISNQSVAEERIRRLLNGLGYHEIDVPWDRPMFYVLLAVFSSISLSLQICVDFCDLARSQVSHTES